MRPAASLYWKIGGWLLLNLALLGAGFHFLIWDESRPEAEVAMAGKPGDRVIAMARHTVEELSGNPRHKWNEILVRNGGEHEVQLLLFDSEGFVMAGPQLEIPGSVMEMVGERSRHGLASELATREFLFGAGPAGAKAESREKDVHLPRPPTLLMNPEIGDEWWYGVQLPLNDRDQGRTVAITLMAHSVGLPASFFKPVPWWLYGSGAVGISLLFWIPLVRNLTAPINDLTAATERIAEGQFDVAVNNCRSDELGRLGEGVNKMAARLEGFVSGQKRFLGDTAHELCSPLARMQMAVGILEAKATADQDGYVTDISEEVQHMSDLVNELLSFSKASLQPQDVKIQIVDLKPVVEQAVKRETQGQAQIQVSVPDRLPALANVQLLSRAVGNLLRNAVRYAAHAGPIGIKAELRDAYTYIVVWDSGPGIADEHLGMIFDPFYRPDASRTSTTGGVGLGMAIVRTCIESCGGHVICKNRKSQGLKVIIRLRSGENSDVSGLTRSDFDLPETD
jgi:two-component system, OmpR family, sensor histidine kinase CpxA